MDKVDSETLSIRHLQEDLAHEKSGRLWAKEEARLARLAALGRDGELRDAMSRWPQANPARAVTAAAEHGRASALAIALSAFEPDDFHPLAAALAIEGGHANCVKLLVSNAYNEDQCDAFRQAARGGDPRLCEVFLEAGRDPMSPYSNDVPCIGHSTALEWAAREGHDEALLLMLGDALRRGAPRLGKASRLAAAGGQLDALRALWPHLDGEERLEAFEEALEWDKTHDFHVAAQVLDMLQPQDVQKTSQSVFHVLAEKKAQMRHDGLRDEDDDFYTQDLADWSDEKKQDRLKSFHDLTLVAFERGFVLSKDAEGATGADLAIGSGEKTFGDWLLARQARREIDGVALGGASSRKASAL